MNPTKLPARLQRLRQAFANGRQLPGPDDRRGLTLVELAIVLLVLGIIMAIVFSSLDPSVTEKAVRLQIKAASNMVPIKVNEYESTVGQLEDRSTLAILAQKSTENPAWTPVKQDLILDAWKNPYQVRVNEAGEKQIWSLGADKQEGGEGKNADFCITDESTWPAWLSGKAQ